MRMISVEIEVGKSEGEGGVLLWSDSNNDRIVRIVDDLSMSVSLMFEHSRHIWRGIMTTTMTMMMLKMPTPVFETSVTLQFKCGRVAGEKKKKKIH